MTDSTTGGITATHGFSVVTLDGAYAAAIVKHADKIQAMIEGGVFEMKHGKATLGFKDGKLHNIHLDRLTYQRGSTKAVIPTSVTKNNIVP